MEKNRKPRGGKGGRPAKNDPAVYRFSVNFSAVEHARFLDLYEQSGLLSKAAFIKARVFNGAFRVVKTDRRNARIRGEADRFPRPIPCRGNELQPGGEGAARAFFREENTRAAL